MFDLTRPPGLGRRVLLCGLAHGAALLNDVVDLMLDNQAPVRALSPSPFEDCDCGEQHESSPVLAAALAARGATVPAAQPGPEFSPAFADSVHVGDLVSLDGLGGRETASRVFVARKVRQHGEGEMGYGSSAAVTLPLEDRDSGAVISPTLSVHQGVRVAPGVPDGIPADFAGGAA